MKNKFLKFEIFSTIFIMFIGTILHFTYNISNKSTLVGIFSAINESTWEHLKLLFFPSLITIIIGYFIFQKTYSNYICAKTKGLFLGLSFLVIFFYTYTGVIGQNIAFLNIGSFFVAVLISEIYAYKKINNYSCNQPISFISLAILLICFVLFTFYPPQIGLFKDPLTNSYGLVK